MTSRRAGKPHRPPSASGVRRRDVLKGGGAVAALALLEGCREREAVFLEQAFDRSAGLAGVAVWKPGVCAQCAAGCGVSVRVIDGDAKKLEGLAEHPVNRGGLCALGQSGLQELYNPDRITTPLRRRAGVARGTAQPADFEPIDWQQALEAVSPVLTAAHTSGRWGVITGDDPIVRGLWRRLTATAGSLGSAKVWRALAPDALVELEAARRVFGWRVLPAYDLDAAGFVLGLGAPFLDRWHSPVQMARSLTEARAHHGSRFVHAEPRMSLTAAAADQWLAVRPGFEGVLARAIAGRLMATERVDREGAARYGQLFPGEAPTLEVAAEVTGLQELQIASVADELARARRPVVIAGGSSTFHRNGVYDTASGMALNLLLGRVGKEGGIVPSASLGLDEIVATTGADAVPNEIPGRPVASDLAELDLLLVCEDDPLRTAARGSGLRSAIREVEQLVVLSSFFDDTALEADIILPLQHDLERFQLVEPVMSLRPALSVASPAIKTEGEGRHPIDVVLALMASQDVVSADLPWESSEDVARTLMETGLSGLVREDETARGALRRAQREGGLWAGDGLVASASAGLSDDLDTTPFVDPPDGPSEPKEGSFRLVPFESVKSGDGRGANRPWLQELPDPMSSVMWQTWVELSPLDAKHLGVATGDWVRVRATGDDQTIQVGVFVSPATRPGTVGMPLGHGHRELGRYARGRGVNVMDLVGDQRVEGTTALAIGEVTVELERLEKRRPLAIFGRGLRQAEPLPREWASPHADAGHKPETEGSSR